jgi:hypothetical protein
MEAWSGIPPFRRATPDECDDAMRNPHPKPSDYDPRLIPLDDVIVRAMKLDPKERQQDAADVARALRAFLQGTDLADIARELGDRVRDLREALSEPMPRSLDGSARTPNPSVGDLGTKTFAARDEAIRWSRPPAAEIEEPPGASTRKLRESMPPPAEIVEPTPLGETPVSITNSAVKSERAGADTLATKPLETAVRDEERSRPELAKARSRTWSLVAFAALLAVGGGAAWRMKSAPGRTDGIPTATATTMSAPTTTVAPVVPSTAVAPPPSAKPGPSAALAPLTVAPTGATQTAPGPSVSAPASAVTGRAFVSFLGDPGTRVSIDGASRGSCPVRMNLEPGQHDVRFQFDPTGESRGERFSVKAGERVTVRAEFTGATPTVRIQR